jgi:hypothetical protein
VNVDRLRISRATASPSAIVIAAFTRQKTTERAATTQRYRSVSSST